MISQLMDVISEPVRTMVWLSLLTGLRIGEVLGLPWKNVDFTSGQIRVTQAFYRGTIGSPKTKCCKRLVSIPTALRTVLIKLYESSKHEEEELVSYTVNGTPYNDSNLLHRCLKSAGQTLGMPWLSGTPCGALTSRYSRRWEALCGTHRLNWVIPKMSTTLEIYTLPIPEQQRTTVEKLSVLMANDGKLEQNPERLRLASQQIQ